MDFHQSSGRSRLIVPFRYHPFNLVAATAEPQRHGGDGQTESGVSLLGILRTGFTEKTFYLIKDALDASAQAKTDALKAPKEWHDFAEAAFAKAMKHLEKYPEDKVDAWNDERFDLKFWLSRAKDEDTELEDAIKDLLIDRGRLNEDYWDGWRQEAVMNEALDKANMALFIYFYIKKQRPKSDSLDATAASDTEAKS
jgi:hypothetical protein